MKQFRVLMLFVLALAAARADVLRLRDGTVLVGNYVGGTQTEVWFQRSPAGAEAFPLFAVESLKFGGVLGFAPGSYQPGNARRSDPAVALRIHLVRSIRLTSQSNTGPAYRMPVLIRSFNGNGTPSRVQFLHIGIDPPSKPGHHIWDHLVPIGLT